MKGRCTIELEGVRLYAPHGVYAGEGRTGNEFEVALQLGIAGPDGRLLLSDSIDYVRVHAILRSVFSEREELLEVLCQKVAAELHGAFPQLLDINIRIRKLTPAIANFTGTVGVSYSKAFTSLL